MTFEHKVAAAVGDDLAITVICSCGYTSDTSTGMGTRYDMPQHIAAKNRVGEAAA